MFVLIIWSFNDVTKKEIFWIKNRGIKNLKMLKYNCLYVQVRYRPIRIFSIALIALIPKKYFLGCSESQNFDQRNFE